MTDRHPMFDHTIVIDRIRPWRWRARIYRSMYDTTGMFDPDVIVGSARVADLYGWTRMGALWSARRLVAKVRRRGARWPKPDDS